MLKVKGDIAVFVGRFQVDQLHAGQREILDRLVDDYQKVIVALGVSPTLGTKDNPMDYATREAMIKLAYKSVVVVPVFDHSSDAEWSKQLDTLLRKMCPIGDIMIFGGRDSFKEHYTGSYPVTEIETQETSSGTTIREQIGKEVVAHSEFRRGIIYSTQNQYPKIFPTVDIAVVKRPNENNDVNEDKILLARKQGTDEWRLPGGFVDLADGSYVNAACRELREETSLSVDAIDLKYVGSFSIKDWRYPKDMIFTTLFMVEPKFGHAEAKDDIEEVHWFNLSTVKVGNVKIAREHKKLIEKIPNPNALDY